MADANPGSRVGRREEFELAGPYLVVTLVDGVQYRLRGVSRIDTLCHITFMPTCSLSC